MTWIARHLARGWRPGAAALALAVAGCAAGGADGRPGASAVGEGARPAPAAGQFAPPVAPVPAYGASVGKCQGSSAIHQVKDELDADAKSAGRAAPRQDGPICGIAETFLRWEPGSASPRPEVLEFVSRWFGITTPVIPPSIAVLDTDDPKAIADRIVQSVAPVAANAASPRLGIATQRTGRYSNKIAIVLVDDPVQFDPPFPKRLELGQKATLSGRLLGGYRSPVVEVSDAAGQASKPAQGAGPTFQAEIACGDRPGRIYVEIRAQSDTRSGTVARFPVGCGSDLPASISLAPEPWPSDTAAAEKKIVELVNQERTAAGLSAVKPDPAVAAVARSISEDLAARGGTPSGDVAERLKREGVSTALVLQSAGAERSYERVHERLVTSPSNRANILSRDVTDVGVGAVTKPDVDGRPMVYVTEVFIKQLPPVDLGKTRQDLKAAMAQKRKDARTTPLTFDPLLDETAQKFAAALAAGGGTLDKEKQAEITAPLHKTMKTLSILSGAKPDPLDFAEEPAVTAVAKVGGVGVAQGKHPVLGRNAVYVVLMVGTTRGDAEAPKREAVRGTRKVKPAK